jgi:hypothetical protein
MHKLNTVLRQREEKIVLFIINQFLIREVFHVKFNRKVTRIARKLWEFC